MKTVLHLDFVDSSDLDAWNRDPVMVAFKKNNKWIFITRNNHDYITNDDIPEADEEVEVLLQYNLAVANLADYWEQLLPYLFGRSDEFAVVIDTTKKLILGELDDFKLDK